LQLLKREWPFPASCALLQNKWQTLIWPLYLIQYT